VHSSTSSSEPKPQWPEEYWKRPIPDAHWRGVALMTVLIVSTFLVAWEFYWRFQGYGPSFENTADQWTAQRVKVGTDGANETVIIGSSRILFDLDLDMWQQALGGPRPIELAVVGTCPLPALHDLAEDESFKGTLLCGVTEAIFFIPAPAPPSENLAKYVRYAKHWSPTARASYHLSIPLESAFAFLNQEDLKLDALFRRWIPIANRPGAMVMPPYPPYFQTTEYDSRNKMWSRMETDPVLQQKVQQVWLPLFKMAPPFGGPGLDALIGSINADVEKIRARGGRVVFMRFPSTGELRQFEKEMWPRAAFWDRLLRETGAPGIHFEDHPELSGFDCPEWSHLTRADAVTYTRSLATIYKKQQ